jgi:hypothetical protein
MNHSSLFNDSKVEAAIAFLLSQHAAEQAQRASEVTETVIGFSNGPKPRKASAKQEHSSCGAASLPAKVVTAVESKQDASQADSSTNSDNNRNPAPPPVSDPLPQAGKQEQSSCAALSSIVPGTLTPQAFIVAMRRAKSREEQIKAIAGYVGYDSRQLFGAQETMARMQANRAISGHKLVIRTPAETHNAYRSVQGYCAGMPNHDAKRLADLKAREVETVESMVKCEEVGNLIMAEECRVTLSQIRALIDTLETV